MAALTCRPASPKKLDEEVGCAIDHFGGIRKPADGVDVAVNADDALDCVERTKMVLQHGQLRERTRSGGGIAFFNRTIEAGCSGDYTFGPGRDHTGQKDEMADRLYRKIITAGNGRSWESETDFAKPRFRSRCHRSRVTSVHLTESHFSTDAPGEICARTDARVR
jgi:hypothetical protein